MLGSLNFKTIFSVAVLFFGLNFVTNMSFAIACDPACTSGQSCNETTGTCQTSSGSATVFTASGLLCRAYKIVAGPIGKVLAILTLVMIGISFFMAKITWATAVMVFLGIASIFGAPKIVKFTTGGDEPCVGTAEATTADI